MSARIQIGELARTTGVPARTIRFYEAKGIIPEPDRSPSGYRLYDAQAVNRLRFLRRAQSAGLTLGEIRGVVAIRDSGEAPCVHTLALLASKRREVIERLRELDELRTELDRLVESGGSIGPDQCAADDVCSIIGRSPS